MESSQDGSRTAGRQRGLMLWLFAITATVLLYWLVLRFLQPGYFAPQSPFHIDFYDYVGMRMKAASTLLFHYPRPIAYYAMHVLGAGGMDGFMMGAIALALANVLLTAAYVRRLFHLHSAWFFAALLLYLLLNIAHPQFYPEHRHDLPAMVSYFGLILALLAWQSWLRIWEGGVRRSWIAPLSLLILAAVICFAFSKETYFISALCLLTALAISEPSRRWFHVALLVLLLTVEVASFLWTRSTNSPFVNVNAGADSTYMISLAPVSILRTFAFYVYHLINPWLLALLILAAISARLPRARWILLAAFPIAALGAFGPHSMLPNHKFPEYAWAGAPLFLAPVLLVGAPGSRLAHVGMALVLSIAAIAGPWGYWRRYDAPDLKWVMEQERLGGALVKSLDELRAIPARSRVLVTGLDQAAVPWQLADFIRLQFGDEINWTLVFPPEVSFRRGSRVTAFVNASDVKLDEYDYVATYRPSGELVNLREIKAVPAAEKPLAVIVPAVAGVLAKCHDGTSTYQPWLDCAAVALQWERPNDAAQYLARAERSGGNTAPAFQDLTTRAAAMKEKQAAGTITATLNARPETIVNAKSGVGITELFWNIPDGLAVEVHVDSPSGPLFAAATRSGSARTAEWVKDGMQFFLQNVTGGKPLTHENTLASVKVRVSP